MGALQELEKQNVMMTTQGKMIEEQLDSVFEEDNDSEEMEDVVAQVMREAGVVLPSASTQLLGLEQRLEILKNPPLRN